MNRSHLSDRRDYANCCSLKGKIGQMGYRYGSAQAKEINSLLCLSKSGTGIIITRREMAVAVIRLSPPTSSSTALYSIIGWSRDALVSDKVQPPLIVYGRPKVAVTDKGSLDLLERFRAIVADRNHAPTKRKPEGRGMSKAGFSYNHPLTKVTRRP